MLSVGIAEENTVEFKGQIRITLFKNQVLQAYSCYNGNCYFVLFMLRPLTRMHNKESCFTQNTNQETSFPMKLVGASLFVCMFEKHRDKEDLKHNHKCWRTFKKVIGILSLFFCSFSSNTDHG